MKSLIKKLKNKFSPQIIIGLGSGRSGTQSLAVLMNKQAQTHFTHEKFPLAPWDFDYQVIEQKLYGFYKRVDKKRVGDVASSYLMYVEFFLQREPTTKFICLRRDKNETVASFMKKTEGRNHWVKHNGFRWRKDEFDEFFPKYEVEDKQTAIEMYWEDYYKKAEFFEKKFPDNFKIFSLNNLNTTEGLNKIFDFIEIPQKSRNLETNIQVNRNV